ncbi:pseudouridine synthase [Treponema sp.]|uniref:pseudouridine synthase n=1 Tax=Treponema sp. TaxID=166 RepID=UPI00388DCF99
MNFINFTAGNDDEGRRLDRVIRKFISEESLSLLYKSLRKGFIKIDGKKCTGNYRITSGNNIQIADFLLTGKNTELSETEINAVSKKLISDLKKITVLKTNELLFINKPYDYTVQPVNTNDERSLSILVQREYELTHSNNSLSFKTGPLHRLDRKTTGILTFSQNLEGAKYFSQAIKLHKIQKYYIAILQGKLEEKQIWQDIITKNENQSSNFHTVSVNQEDGKESYTEVTPVSHGLYKGTEVTLAIFFIKTGRTHQIRSQSSFHGFPLLGDTAYNGRKINSLETGRDFFLHAYKLKFPENNPFNLPEEISSPLDKDFLKMIETSEFPAYTLL